MIHASAMALLGLLMISGPSAGTIGPIDTVWSSEDIRGDVSDTPVNLETSNEESGGSSVNTLPFIIGAETAFPEPLREIEHPLLVTDRIPQDSMDLTAKVAPLGGGAGLLDALGEGDGTGAGVGDGSGGSFFGLNAAGKRFVFVVDASGSMRRPFDGPGKSLLGRVKLEILSSVVQMSEDQQFFIVFFNDDAIPMHAETLVSATMEAKKLHMPWMAKVEARGNTEPENALALAIHLNPDVIYFLTDGAFKYRVIDRVTEMNSRRHITIHTVSFGGDERSMDFMKQVAAKNHGTFQVVSPEGAGEASEAAASETADEPTQTADAAP